MTDEATGRVTGIRYRQGGEGEDIEMPAAAVVLTTGGECGVRFALIVLLGAVVGGGGGDGRRGRVGQAPWRYSPLDRRQIRGLCGGMRRGRPKV